MVWDFLLAGVDEEARVSAKEGTSEEFLGNLDFVCLALLQLQRDKLLAGDYMACLKFSTKPLKLDCHQDVVQMAHRIKKIFHEKHASMYSIIEKSNFPSILERDVEKFMQGCSLNHSQQLSESQDSPQGCYSVKEVSSEIEEDAQEEEEKVHDLSQEDRMQQAEEVDQVFNPRQGSVVVDEDGEKFLDCLSEEPHSDSPSDLVGNKRLFKIKDTKAKVIFDQATKQRRFMSPFEQFLAEQQELFKKDELRQNDEQNSVTLTTTASTTFEAKTLQSGGNEENLTPRKTTSQKNLKQTTTKLARLANEMKYDAAVKQAEDQIMIQRKQNLQQLKTIKSYLSSLKIGKEALIRKRLNRA